MTKRFAFTLAEVLIALAIIGVVAAMTIPTFMANTAGAQFRTGFKKGITVLTQAASANYATEGYDFSGTNGYAGGGTLPVNQYDSNTSGATPTLTSEAGNLPVIIGFESASTTEQGTASDFHPETPSLFHLFQNNLNMKNSREIANYAVMPADITLNCAGPSDGSTGANSETGSVTVKYNVPGVTLGGSGDAKFPTGLGNRLRGSGTIQGGGGLANLCSGRALDNGGFNQGRMFQLEDGMTVTYDGAQAYCTESNPCYGYIDVNGPAGPNRVIACSQAASGASNADGWISNYGRAADTGMLLADCTVEAKDITDIYPILFYGSSVKPASLAAKSVLYSRKSNQIAEAPTTP